MAHFPITIDMPVSKRLKPLQVPWRSPCAGPRVTRIIEAFATHSVTALVTPLITALVTTLVTGPASRHHARHWHFAALDRIGTFPDSQAR